MLVAWIIMGSFTDAWASDVPLIQNVTVCELFQHGDEKFDRRLRIEATAWVDFGHGAMLKGASCNKGETIDFRFSDRYPKNARTEAFDKALTGDVMDHSLRVFDVRIVGRFAPASRVNGHGMFEIEDVEWFRKSRPSSGH